MPRLGVCVCEVCFIEACRSVPYLFVVVNGVSVTFGVQKLYVCCVTCLCVSSYVCMGFGLLVINKLSMV